MMNVLLAAGASAAVNHPRSSHQLLYALLPIVILVVLFDVYCLINLSRAKSVRHLPKAVWAIIIVVISAPWGGLLYLFLGRDRGQGFLGRDRGQGFLGRDRGQGFLGRDRSQGFLGRHRGHGAAAPR